MAATKCILIRFTPFHPQSWQGVGMRRRGPWGDARAMLAAESGTLTTRNPIPTFLYVSDATGLPHITHAIRPLTLFELSLYTMTLLSSRIVP